MSALVALCLLLAAPLASEGESLTVHPLDGASTIYYDMDCRGRILKIDYENSRAEVMAQLPPDSIRPQDTLFGWFLPDDDLAYLFVTDWSQPVAGRFDTMYVFDLRADTFVPTELKVSTEGDCTFVPVSRNTFFFQGLQPTGADTAGALRLVPSPTVSAIDATLLHASWSLASNKECVYTAIGYRNPVISKIDTKTGATVSKRDSQALLGVQDDTALIHVAAMEDSYAAFGLKLKEGIFVALVDLESGMELPRTPLPARAKGRYRWSLQETGENRFQLRAFPEEKSPGKYIESASAYIYDLEPDKGTLAAHPEINYNQKTQIALLGSSGVVKVLPRYRFDYVSIRDLWNWQLDWPSASAEKVESAIAALNKTLKGENNEIVVYPELYRYIPVRHLEIVEREQTGSAP